MSSKLKFRWWHKFYIYCCVRGRGLLQEKIKHGEHHLNPFFDQMHPKNSWTKLHKTLHQKINPEKFWQQLVSTTNWNPKNVNTKFSIDISFDMFLRIDVVCTYVRFFCLPGVFCKYFLNILEEFEKVWNLHMQIKWKHDVCVESLINILKSLIKWGFNWVWNGFRSYKEFLQVIPINPHLQIAIKKRKMKNKRNFFNSFRLFFSLFYSFHSSPH